MLNDAQIRNTKPSARPMTFVRTSELIGARWPEFNLERALGYSGRKNEDEDASYRRTEYAGD